MHEGDLAARVVEAALAAAAGGAGAARRVREIEVRAAPDAVPSDDALAFHVERAAAGTPAEGARLVVRLGTAGSGVVLLSVDVDDEAAGTAAVPPLAAVPPAGGEDQASRA